jgi:hypothetical protein
MTSVGGISCAATSVFHPYAENVGERRTPDGWAGSMPPSTRWPAHTASRPVFGILSFSTISDRSITDSGNVTKPPRVGSPLCNVSRIPAPSLRALPRQRLHEQHHGVGTGVALFRNPLIIRRFRPFAKRLARAGASSITCWMSRPRHRYGRSETAGIRYSRKPSWRAAADGRQGALVGYSLAAVRVGRALDAAKFPEIVQRVSRVAFLSPIFGGLPREAPRNRRCRTRPASARTRPVE